MQPLEVFASILVIPQSNAPLQLSVDNEELTIQVDEAQLNGEDSEGIQLVPESARLTNGVTAEDANTTETAVRQIAVRVPAASQARFRANDITQLIYNDTTGGQRQLDLGSYGFDTISSACVNAECSHLQLVLGAQAAAGVSSETAVQLLSSLRYHTPMDRDPASSFVIEVSVAGVAGEAFEFNSNPSTTRFTVTLLNAAPQRYDFISARD